MQFKPRDIVKIRNTYGNKEVVFVYIKYIQISQALDQYYIIEGDILYSNDPTKEFGFMKKYVSCRDIIYKIDEKDFLEIKKLNNIDLEMRIKMYLLKNS
jgi:hypothetical protein